MDFIPPEPAGKILEIASTLSDLVDAPYGVPKLVFIPGWRKRLGLVRPDLNGPISLMSVHFDSSWRQVDSGNSVVPWHHWVFLPEHQAYSSKGASCIWEDAFNELIRRHAVSPAANNANFHYVSKTNPVNTLWGAEGPALIHFTTEMINEKPVRMLGQDGNFYDKVSMRIFELPLASDLLHLVPGTFPSPLNQLRSLTHNTEAWKQSPAVELTRMSERLNKHIREKKEKSQTYGRIARVYDKIYPTFSLPYLSFVKVVSSLSGMAGQAAAAAIETHWNKRDKENCTNEESALRLSRQVVEDFLTKLEDKSEEIKRIAGAVEVVKSLHDTIPSDWARGILKESLDTPWASVEKD